MWEVSIKHTSVSFVDKFPVTMHLTFKFYKNLPLHDTNKQLNLLWNTQSHQTIWATDVWVIPKPNTNTNPVNPKPVNPNVCTLNKKVHF